VVVLSVSRRGHRHWLVDVSLFALEWPSKPTASCYNEKSAERARCSLRS
jgi:hypothetical protein